MTVPPQTAAVQLYLDPAVFARERQLIFARTWQFIGLEADILRVGDYLSETVAGFPVVVIRDDYGALRGYHNVCRHRAGPLVTDGKGRCDRQFVCRYHDWRYGFDGKLKEATGFGPADGFNVLNLPLFPIRVETWLGFVFVNLDAQAAPLIDTLRPLDERLGRQAYRSARLYDHHPMACNWKLYVENYLDGYHREGVHKGLAAEAGTKRHEVRMHGSVALYEVPNRSSGTAGLWAWVWPNLGLNIYQGVLLLEHIRPQGPDRVTIEHIFLHEPEDPGVDAAIHDSERITDEDAWICERVQKNLSAGIFSQGVLSPAHEGAVAWFQQRVAQALAGG
jgi:choline monooxygenase